MVVFLVQIVNLIFQIYIFMMFGYILMSWVPNLQGSPLGQFLARFVEPVLTPFRKLIPPLGMFDFSPIVAFMALYFAKIGAIKLILLIFGAF